MSRTIVGLNDPKAIKKQSAFLAVDTAVKSYWDATMTGVGEQAHMPVQMLTDLSKQRGDSISFDLVMQLRQMYTEGDETMAGNEEEARFYSDSLLVNQMRHGMNSGGKMSQQRTLHDLQKVGRQKVSDYIARVKDELHFVYASGARGVNTDYILPSGFTSFAGNALAPVNSATDPEHIMWGGAATSSATILGTSQQFDVDLLNRMYARANTIGGGTQSIPSLEPCKIGGEDHYVVLMHVYQDYALRNQTGVGGWADVQKTLVMKAGTDSPLYNGSQGVWNGMILKKHRKVVRFSNYGGGAVTAARALVLGRQALVCAYAGEGSDTKYQFWEDTEDRGNIYVAGFESIFGVKKTQFTIDGVARDFGVIAADTYIPASI